MLDRKERIAEFLRRLDAAAAVGSHDEAFQLLSDTLNAVEDEFSGVTADPANYLNDGRLYPPQADNRRPVPGRPDLVRYRSKGHNTWIGSNGSIRIEDIPKGGTDPICCLDKAGIDGGKVNL